MNRFSQPQQGEFMNTYVAPPLEMMKEVLERKQQAYDYRKAMGQAYEDQVTGLSVYGEAAGKYLAGVQQEFSGVLESLKGKDLLDPNNQKAMDGAIAKISKDKDLQGHLAANKYIKEWKDNYDKLNADNGIHRANTYAYEKAMAEYSSTGKVSSALSNTSINKATERFKELNKYYEQLKANGSQGLAYLSGAGGVGQADKIAYEVGNKGIDMGRIKANTDQILNLAASDAVGQEIFREYDMLMDMSGGKSTPEGKMEYLKQQLLSVGQQHVYNEQTTSGLASAVNKRTEDGLRFDVFGTMNNGIKDQMVAEHIRFKPDGSIDYVSEDGGLGAKTGAAIKALWDTPFEDWVKTVPAAYNSVKGEVPKEAMEVGMALNIAAKANGVTPKQMAERQNQPVHLRYKTFTPKQAEVINKIMLGPDGNSIANLANFGIFDERKNKSVEAGQAIVESLQRQGVDGADNLTPTNVFDYIKKGNIPYTFMGEAKGGNPIGPAVYQMRLGNESLNVNLVNMDDKEMMKRWKDAKLITDGDVSDHRNAKLHYYGYLKEYNNSTGKRQLEINHLEVVKDENGNMVERPAKTKFIPLEN